MKGKSAVHLILGDSSKLIDWVNESNIITKEDLVIASCRSEHKPRFASKNSIHFKADLSIDEEITKLMKSISINIGDIQQKNLYVYFFSTIHSTLLDSNSKENIESIFVNTIAPWRILSKINNIYKNNITIYFISSLSYFNPLYPNKIYAKQKYLNTLLYKSIANDKFRIRIAICGQFNFGNGKKLGPISSSRFIPKNVKNIFLASKIDFINFLENSFASRKELIVVYLPRIWISRKFSANIDYD